MGLNYDYKSYVAQFYKSMFTLVDKRRYICADLWDSEISLFEQDDNNQVKVQRVYRPATLSPSLRKIIGKQMDKQL
jgi:hypothetical protein